MILNQFSRVVPLVLLLAGCSQIDQSVRDWKFEVENFFQQRREVAKFAEAQIAVLRETDLTRAQVAHDICTIDSYYHAARSLVKKYPWYLIWGQWLSMNATEREARHKKAVEALVSELTVRLRTDTISFNCKTLEASTVYGVVKRLELLIREEALEHTTTTPQERREVLVKDAKERTGQLYLRWQLFEDGKWCAAAQRLLAFIEEDRMSHTDLGLDKEVYGSLHADLLDSRKNFRVYK